MIAENTVNQIDALELLRALPEASVDCVLTDPPYGTTDLSWDKSVDWSMLWPELARVITQRGAIVVTAQNPFAAELIVSNRKMFRYEWVWEKNRPGGFVNAAVQPMRAHELILVFSHSLHVNGAHADRLMNYFPQTTKGILRGPRSGIVPKHYHGASVFTTIDSGLRLPWSVINIGSDHSSTVHPTQKPVALFEYLIRTYTRPGDLVVDPFGGSGTTAVAARNLGRRYITGDTDAGYCEIMRRRLSEPFTPQLFPEADTVDDAPRQVEMFAADPAAD